jgi:sugar phosphate isomerase/epimerase
MRGEAGSSAAPSPSRRALLRGASAAALASVLPDASARAGNGRFGIAYTSFAVRLRQGRDLIRGAPAGLGAAFPAETFLDLCRSFGADGVQMDIAQLRSREPEYLDGLRRSLSEAGLFLELSIDGDELADETRYAGVAEAARRLGAVRFRVALLHGRRYEDFSTIEKWREFADRWKAALPRAKPWIERQRIPVGIENHKDFRIQELVALLRSVDSPYLGACVDFGNNVAFLEDPLELAEALAPFAITTHLKDMAVRPYEQGFELSEVPLGSGFLPLVRMVEVIRKQRPEAPLVLEMITRDPLKVPYLEDRYWTTFGGRDAALVERFRSTLAKAWTQPLPKVSGLTLEQMLAAEDDNVRRCAAHARAQLGA